MGGLPYTPYDIPTSTLKQVWDVRGSGVPDDDLLDTKRNPLIHQLDVWLDKKYFFDKWSLDLYVDIQNIINATFELEPPGYSKG